MEFISQVETDAYRNGKTSIEISEEIKLPSALIDFPVPNFSPFYEVFEETIQKLIEAGVCPLRLDDHLISRIVPPSYAAYDEEIPPLVLSMEDLGVGFEVCLIPLAFSLVVFIFEVIYPKAKQIVKDYLTASFTVLTFIKNFKPGV